MASIQDIIYQLKFIKQKSDELKKTIQSDSEQLQQTGSRIATIVEGSTMGVEAVQANTMSMITELIAAISNAERQIDDQIGKLNSYKSQISQVKTQVENAFGGSQSQDANAMLQQLSSTETQINETISNLQNAKDKLLRVRAI